MPKFIITTGGVMSGLGKGIVSASVGRILQSYGYKVTCLKIDPYLNVDAGTMNPFEHGEVFVLDDGGEVDMDLGNYERFLNISLTKAHNMTTGKAYKAVIEKERTGDYLGKTVQIIPHVTDEIVRAVRAVGKDNDVVVVELGGTVGDIESMPFLEAMRQLHLAEGSHNVLFLHVTLIPVLNVVGEQKTKPTQHSVQRLQEAGIQPDLVVARAQDVLEEKTRQKIANFCNVHPEDVISDPDARVTYEVPLLLEKERIGEKITRKLGLTKKSDMNAWKKVVDRMVTSKKEVHIALAGKYTALNDSYVSVLEALRHAAAVHSAKVKITWIDTEDFEKDTKALKILDSVDGLVVPGGFGSRGAEGKIAAINYARTKKIPFLGLCYGLQLATIGFAREVAGLKDANTTENDPKCKHPVIDILPEQYQVKEMGGTMRLGSMPCALKKGSLARDLYKSDLIQERHRHRYEVNPGYIEQLEKAGLVFSGQYPDQPIMEIVELPESEHPFFMGTQFHPEFKSRPDEPSAPFAGFMKACLN